MAIGVGICAGAIAQSMPKVQYKSANAAIAAENKAARAACGRSLSSNAKNICNAEASGREKVAKAELEAKYKPSQERSYRVHVARANSDYSVAKELCNYAAANAKHVCVKEAKAAAVGAKADALTQMKITNANQKAAETSARAIKVANEKASDARKDSVSDKNDADYALAKERCDFFSSDAKSNCVNQAKARFGKS